MSALLFCFLLLTLALIATVCVAARSGGESERPIREGQRLLCVMGGFSLLLVLVGRNDWTHLQWSVTYPMWGMFTGVGLLLLQTWPRDRALRPEAWYGRSGAAIALVWLLALGVLPPVLAHALGEPFPVGRVSGSSLAALFDAARYGFGGSIPSLMMPVGEDQIARGLGSPPRFVTVALITSMTAAAGVVTFVALALLGRLLRSSVLRGAFWLLSPVALVVVLSTRITALEDALWRNEPWVLRLYGPTIVAAIVAAVLLAVTIWFDRRRLRRTTGERSDSTGSVSLPTRILLGLVLGAAVGLALNLAFPDGQARSNVVWWADNVAKPAGDIFLRMLFMVVVPLVFSSLVLGVAGLGDVAHLGRLGRRTMVWFVGTTALAAAIGLFLVNVLAPGEGLSPEVREEVMAEFAGHAQQRIDQAAAGTGFSIHTFVNIIPRNVFASAGNERETLGVIFFALMVGIAITRIPRERTRVFLDVVETVYEVCAKILGFAMALAPYGVFGLIFAVTSKLGLDIMRSLGAYVVTALVGLLFFQFVVLPALAFFLIGVTPRKLFRGAKALLITAFSTSSSNATLPTTIKTAIDEFNVPKPIAGFVMPLGATMNMNGTALFEGVTVLFLAQVAGVELSLTTQAIVIGLAVLTAIGAAGVPGGSLPLLTIVLAQVGVPPEMIALIIGTDRIVDMTRTMPNVTSDLLCSMWLAKTEQARAEHEPSPGAPTAP